MRAAPPLRWHAWLRGRGHLLCRCTREGSLGLPLVGSAYEAAAEKIEARPAKHVAFHHFQAIDMALHGTRTPGQRHARFDRCIVLPEPTRKASYGLQRTRTRPLQPRLQVLGLALAHEVGKVLREVDRLGDLGRLRVELSELLGLGLRALLCASQDQPGRPAGRQGLGDRLRHHRQDLAPALAAGWDALGLADAADVGRDAARASRVPVRLDLLKELDGGVAPGVPALQEIRLIGIEDTPPRVATVLPDGPGRGPQIPLDGATTTAHLPRNRPDTPALAVEGPHLVIDRPPAPGGPGRAG